MQPNFYETNPSHLHAKYARALNLNDAASGSMAKINDQPTSIRTWKGVNMHGDFHILSKQKVASDEDQALVRFNGGGC